MVNIILCGVAGTGKHRLIENLQRQCKHVQSHTIIRNNARKVLEDFSIHSRKDFQCDDKIYEKVQREIIAKQCEAELQCQTEYITDNGIVSAFVHAHMCLRDSESVDRIESSRNVKEVLKRYQSSLVVLMCYSSSREHDVIGLQCLQEDRVHSVKLAFKEFLNRHSIPFIILSSADIETQIKCLSRAIQGDVPLHTATLDNYIMQKKDDQNRRGGFASTEVQRSFQLSKVMLPKQEAKQIPTIKIKEQSYEQLWTRFSSDTTNRFISVYGHERLACIQFDDSIRSSRVQKTLLDGVMINGDSYSFLGCSSGGMKKRKCFLWKGSKADAQSKIQSLGEFHEIQTVSKRLARIALLFTEVQLTDVEIKNDNICKLEDTLDSTGKHNFTDGCGMIGIHLATKLYSAIKKSIHDDYLPSVFQIRLQGYKGVLALDTDPNNIDRISVRPSMEKFKTNEFPTIGICDYSRPNTFGNLNKQYIMLLSGLGVPDETFLQKQKQYLDRIESVMYNTESAIVLLQWQNKFEVAQIIAKAGRLENVADTHRQFVRKELKNLQSYLREKIEKLSILIPESRNMFGVCDPSFELDYGECFIRVTLSGKPTSIRGKVVICKNPCYLLGDVRVLRAVTEADKPELSQIHHLVDCIVFPSKGKRPHSTEIAGSDLDGDKYFVSWDSELIPHEIRPPYDYPAINTTPEGKVTIGKQIEYFARQNETGKMMGRINNYFIRWADIKGVNCDECEMLGQLFARAVDAIKSGENLSMPPGLLPPDIDSDGLEPTFVWQSMIRNATKYKTGLVQGIVKQVDEHISDEFALDIVQKEDANISEYEKFKFGLFHLKIKTGLDETALVDRFTSTYSKYINFAKFSIEEKREAIQFGFPRNLLLNALNKSEILSEEDRQYFLMNSSVCRWNHLVSKEQEVFEWGYLLKALSTHDSTLIVLAMPDDVIIQLQFLEKQTLGKEIPLDPGTVTAIFISKHFDFRNKYVLGPSYYIDLTEDTLQIYRDLNKHRTLIWLKATDRLMTNGRWNKTLADEIVNSVSMDIQRFPSVNKKGNHPLITKTPFGVVEMYARKIGDEMVYWDIYDANDVAEVTENVETEDENDEDFHLTDTDSLFQETVHEDEMIQVKNEEELHNLYEHVAKMTDPVSFKALIEKRPLERCKLLEYFNALLDNIITKVIPASIPERIATAVEDTVFGIIASSSNTPESCYFATHMDILRLVYSLSRLGMYETARKFISGINGKIDSGIMSYLEALESFPSFAIMEPELNVCVLKLFYNTLDVRLVSRDDNIVEPGIDDDEYVLKLMQYIQHYGFLNGLNLIHETSLQRHRIIESIAKQDTESLKNLKLDKTYDEDSICITLYKTSATSLPNDLLVGEVVAISLQKLVQEHSFPGAVCAVGIIQKLMKAPLSLTIRLSHKVPDVITSTLKSKRLRYWRIDVFGSIVPYKRIVLAMKTIWNQQYKSDIVHVLCHTKIGAEANGHVSAPEDCSVFCPNQSLLDTANLNEEQTQSVMTALDKRLCLIQGPPGTGKTSVACCIVKQIASMNTYNGILVVAETNAAVDNLARRLRNDLLIVRLGNTEMGELYDITVEGHLKTIAANEARKTAYRDESGDSHRDLKLVKRIISSADVVLATCAAAGEASLFEHSFEFVLVDEASKTMETTLLCSLSHSVKHLVMIGDHKQLGPLVPEDPTIPILQDLPHITQLSQSLFHRLYPLMPTCFLEIQYRMHPEIMRFPSEEFYDNRLKAHDSTVVRDPVEFDWPAGKHVPLCFINVEGTERREGSSFANDKEVDVVKEVIDRLLNPDYKPNQKNDRPISVTDIGVLTLYRGQEKALRSQIHRSITVKSVDGFQGQEREVIIVSTVRCNEQKNVGFTGDANRINVLLTRSKRGLVVIGNRRTIDGALIWKRWLSKVPLLSWPNDKVKSKRSYRPEETLRKRRS